MDPPSEAVDENGDSTVNTGLALTGPRPVGLGRKMRQLGSGASIIYLSPFAWAHWSHPRFTASRLSLYNE